MKKLIITIFIICTIVFALPAIAFAAEISSTEPQAVQIARALGIMTGDKNGNMNLSSSVTRAEFAKMTIAASKYKDSVGAGEGVSVYRDVKSDYWASRYIQLAVNEGWLTGYTDGTFRPENNILLEEGATVMLRLLGYSAEDFQGAFPSAQLTKFNALGLNAGISTTKGSNLSRLDCAKLFANLMVTPMKNNEIYGVNLGYDIKNGHINYSAIVNANTKGPFVVGVNGFEPPFEAGVIMKNNSQSSADAVVPYDVFYYNTAMNLIWVYDNKVTGTLSGVAPNMAAPQNVTVAGDEYAVGTPEAAYSISSSGRFRAGDVVTLLLGRDKEVVEIVPATKASMEYYGIVISSEKESVQISGITNAMNKVKIACTDGLERSFFTKASYSSSGNPVMVSYESGETVIKALQNRNALNGIVTVEKFGNHCFAADVKIIDTDVNGKYIRVYPSRLNDSKIDGSFVLGYSLNDAEEIEHLILRNATGDTETYGMLTSVNNESSTIVGDLSLRGEYHWIIDGKQESLVTQNVLYNISTGGAMFKYAKGEISSISNLMSVPLSDIKTLYGQSGDKKYRISEKAQVYINEMGSSYYLATLKSVLNAENFYFTGYIDNFGAPAGGQIRILIAHQKNNN